MFKDTFDDPSQLLDSHTAMKTSFSFCKWKVVRKVFNEIGVSHAENALFYREGVLANINALSENVQTNVR